MKKNNKLFQYVIIGAFVFFIIVGAIMFATYRSDNESEQRIDISLWGTLPDVMVSTFINRYFSENDLKYTVRYQEKNSTTFASDLAEAIASGNGPDAVILTDDLIIRLSNKIYPIPMSSLPEFNFKQSFIQAGEIFLTPDGVLALPLLVDPLVMYWNRDVFNNAGLTKTPATWPEVLSLVPKLTKKDTQGNIIASTVALGEARNVNNVKAILSALMIQAGTPIVKMTETGFESVLNEDFGLGETPAVLSLKFFGNFSNPSRSEYSWNRSWPNSLDAFTSGDLALYFGFSSEYLAIKEKNPNLNFGVAFLPQINKAKILSTYGHIYGLAILKSSSQPGSAYVVLSTLTGQSAASEWVPLFNLPSARRDILGQTESNASKSVFNFSAIMSKSWFDPDSSSTNSVFREMIDSYTSGRESAESVVGTASDRLDSLLK